MAKTLVYQMYPISWGSIRMMTAFLPRVSALGCDYVWLSPIYESPWRNHGYDVADYYDIEPRLGNMEDFDEFVRTAHLMGLKVIMDLPIDSTSVDHSWFLTEPLQYITDRTTQPSSTRPNVLGDSLAWQQAKNRHYLALNHPAQASLNWYKDGTLNRGLIEYFKRIMSYWLISHNVDGFRLEFAQLLNEIPDGDETKLDRFLIGPRAVEVINELSNLYNQKAPFLIMDCIDPNGKVCEFYSRETDIEFFTNRVIRSMGVSRSKSLEGLRRKVANHNNNPKFMLNLESHDVPRFTSRTGLEAQKILEFMFNSGVQTICLYQGQELGLKNPDNLSIHEILSLDSRKELEHERIKISNETLRRESCANARVPIPLDEYTKQEADPESVLKIAKSLIDKWKNS